MKAFLLVALLTTGCTTVYKIDSKGICRASDGKVVKEADINPDRFLNMITGKGYGMCQYMRHPTFYNAMPAIYNGSVSGGTYATYFWR